ncbi:MAG: hypothetical protein PUD59_01280 [bacterium]|nr:hypothetical protein [bacterium]
MKVYEINEDNYKVYINEIILKNYDLSKESDLEKLLKKILLNIKKQYNMYSKGFYSVEIYVNDKIGAYIEFNRIDIFFSPSDIDLKIKIIFNSSFYFKTSDYEIVKNYDDIYFYNDNFYINIDSIDNNIITLIEYGEIFFDKESIIEDNAININNKTKI